LSVVTGIGLDIVPVARMRDLYLRHGARLRDTVFSEAEWAGMPPLPPPGERVPDARLAARTRYLSVLFAAKEAAFKAIAPPPSLAFEWRDIEIETCDPVRLRLAGAVKTHADALGIRRLSGAVCATRTHSAAVIIGETT
jgi:holo-[acyl-carrier protein] synthase